MELNLDTITTRLSSVGRALDCSGCTTKLSNGRWFDSGSREYIFNVKNLIFFIGCMSKLKMHQPGIEPGAPAWQAEILPLNH